MAEDMGSRMSAAMAEEMGSRMSAAMVVVVEASFPVKIKLRSKVVVVVGPEEMVKGNEGTGFS